MKIAAGTTSALKIRAIESALVRFGLQAEVVGYTVSSGVSDQPFGFDQIVAGAGARAKAALGESGAEMAIGIENGLVEIDGRHFDIPCVVVVTGKGDESMSFGSALFVPEWIIERIKIEDMEFGHVIQDISGVDEKDPQKYLSNGEIKREEMITQAIVLAMNKIINANKYLKP